MPLPPDDPHAAAPADDTRRDFLKKTSLLAALAVVPGRALDAATGRLDDVVADALERVPVELTINGKAQKLAVDARTTLLDLLRENLHLTGTKKGCDYGQCGACTVLVDGQRVNACLTLAVMQSGRQVVTIEGLADGDKLHPLQEAFIKHDGFQCGYCTPGQIMSGVACIREGHAGSDEAVREFMSGNICRCGAYPNIVAAIREVKETGQRV